MVSIIPNIPLISLIYIICHISVTATHKKVCEIALIGDWRFNLETLHRDSPFSHQSPDHLYQAHLCGTFSLLAGVCEPHYEDVVGLTDPNPDCEYYGRYSSDNIYNLLDTKSPERGLLIDIGGGSKCKKDKTKLYNTLFEISCNPNMVDQSRMFTGVTLPSMSSPCT